MVEIVPYNLDWPKKFEEYAKDIQLVLGQNCIQIYHIGSTSIPGMTAKEDIDILCVVKDLKTTEVLQNYGYNFKGEVNVPLRYFFKGNCGNRKINLHVCMEGNGFADLNLTFRDYLREHEDVRRSYCELKQKLVKNPKSHEKVQGHFTEYTRSKNEFIKHVLKLANYQGICINFCLHFLEWDAYQTLLEIEEVPSSSKDYHFILYEGVKICTAAYVRICENKAFVKKIRSISDKDFKEEMLRTIVDWCLFHGYAFMNEASDAAR